MRVKVAKPQKVTSKLSLLKFQDPHSFVLKTMPCPENLKKSGLLVNNLPRINKRLENTLLEAWHVIYPPKSEL